MKLEGAVPRVVGADSAVGAAIVRGLLARDALKVHTVSNEPVASGQQPGAVPLTVDLSRPAQADALARELPDATLLVNSMVAVPHGASSLAGSDIQPPGRRWPPLGRTLNLIDAFAPVLADSLRDRLAAQQTQQLLDFRAQLAVGSGDQVLDDQRALAGHVATRVLDGLPGRFSAGGRQTSEHSA
jgi:NAD(P)-dependent dehydrogenase (short-subunit alcohol dehydrogenase family)